MIVRCCQMVPLRLVLIEIIQGLKQCLKSYLSNYSDVIPRNGLTSVRKLGSQRLTVEPNLQQSIGRRPRGADRVPRVWLVVQTIILSYLILDICLQFIIGFIPDEQYGVGEGGCGHREEDMVSVQISEGPVNIVATLSRKHKGIITVVIDILSSSQLHL